MKGAIFTTTLYVKSILTHSLNSWIDPSNKAEHGADINELQETLGEKLDNFTVPTCIRDIPVETVKSHAVLPPKYAAMIVFPNANITLQIRSLLVSEGIIASHNSRGDSKATLDSDNSQSDNKGSVSSWTEIKDKLKRAEDRRNSHTAFVVPPSPILPSAPMESLFHHSVDSPFAHVQHNNRAEMQTYNHHTFNPAENRDEFYKAEHKRASSASLVTATSSASSTSGRAEKYAQGLKQMMGNTGKVKDRLVQWLSKTKLEDSIEATRKTNRSPRKDMPDRATTVLGIRHANIYMQEPASQFEKLQNFAANADIDVEYGYDAESEGKLKVLIKENDYLKAKVDIMRKTMKEDTKQMRDMLELVRTQEERIAKVERHRRKKNEQKVSRKQPEVYHEDDIEVRATMAREYTGVKVFAADETRPSLPAVKPVSPTRRRPSGIPNSIVSMLQESSGKPTSMAPEDRKDSGLGNSEHGESVSDVPETSRRSSAKKDKLRKCTLFCFSSNDFFNAVRLASPRKSSREPSVPSLRDTIARMKSDTEKTIGHFGSNQTTPAGSSSFLATNNATEDTHRRRRR